MTEEKQIEEMAKVIDEFTEPLSARDIHKAEFSEQFAEHLYNANYRKQSEGWWEWYEEWSPSTTEHPRECDECGWRCHECETPLADVVGGYWDDPEEVPNLKFCPDCGAHMKGGAE